MGLTHRLCSVSWGVLLLLLYFQDAKNLLLDMETSIVLLRDICLWFDASSVLLCFFEKLILMIVKCETSYWTQKIKNKRNNQSSSTTFVLNIRSSWSLFIQWNIRNMYTIIQNRITYISLCDKSTKTFRTYLHPIHIILLHQSFPTNCTSWF